MRMTSKEREQINKSANQANQGGRPIDPEGTLALSRKYGINRSTLRNRLRRMPLEDALQEPIKSRLECGQMAAQARWGGAK